MADLNEQTEPDEPQVISPEQEAQEFAEFQKLVKYSDRRAFWKSHPSVQRRVSEINFHA